MNIRAMPTSFSVLIPLEFILLGLVLFLYDFNDVLPCLIVIEVDVHYILLLLRCFVNLFILVIVLEFYQF